MARIVRTGLALLTVQGLTWVSSLMAVLVVPRFLGADHFGLSATATTVVSLGAMIAGLGTNNYVIKETARTPAEVRTLVVNATACRLLAWLAMVAVGAPALFVMLGPGIEFAVFAYALAGGSFTLTQSALLSGLQGLERLGRTALLVSIVGLAGNAALACLLFVGMDVVGMTACLSVLAGVSLSATIVMFMRVTNGPTHLSLQSMRRVAVTGRPYFAWDLGLMLYGSVDLVLLAILSDSGMVGNYAFANRLIGIPVFVSTIITTAVYPSLSASSVADLVWFRGLIGNAARVAILATAPMATGMAMLAGPIVRILTGGEFHQSPVLVVLLAVHIPAAAVHTAFGMALFAHDRQKSMATLAWIATAFNVSANLMAIPIAERAWGNGAIGAAAVTIATEALIGVMVWRWSWSFIDAGALVPGIARTLAACVVMGISVAAANAFFGVWLAIAVGCVVYPVACFATGAVSAGELGGVRRRFRGPRGAVPSAAKVRA